MNNKEIDSLRGIDLTYTLKTLPEAAKQNLLKTYALKDADNHRKERGNDVDKKSSDFSLLAMLDDESDYTPETTADSIIWGTDNYEDKGEGYGFKDFVNDLSIIVPRVDKSKAEQKRRVKEKAEVFTPSWVCNVQNNLVDNHLIGENAFNTQTDNDRNWEPSDSPVNFEKYSGTWLDYICERRLEMTCGESPYLMSPYDTTTGSHIPVRDDRNRFMRIGSLDRKLRVVTENSSKEDWDNYAILALCHTFGYEWQGDNLLLARLNFINTFIEYRLDAVGEYPDEELINDIAEIASWNLWQMDGLKMVEPMSCSETCNSCKKKMRAGHDGKVSALRFLTADGFKIKAFEDLLPYDMAVEKGRSKHKTR